MMLKLKNFIQNVYNESSKNDLNKSINNSHITYITKCTIYKKLTIGDRFIIKYDTIHSKNQYKYAKINNNVKIDTYEIEVEFLGLNGVFQGYEFIIFDNLKFKFKTINLEHNFYLYSNEFLSPFYEEVFSIHIHNLYEQLDTSFIKSKILPLKDKLNLI